MGFCGWGIVDSPRGLEMLLSAGGANSDSRTPLAENDVTFLFCIPRGYYTIIGKVSQH